MLRRLVLVAMLVGTTATGRAQPGPDPGPEQALSQKIAVWRFDALGIEPELVGRLETLFKLELERLMKTPLPTRNEINRATTVADRECTGEDKCLAAIGKKVNVDVVVTGTVGSLGDSYILNIKAVDTATAKTLQKIQTDPLRGSPDDLIESVRVAAYRLLAPAQLHGALQIQSDLVGAAVELDGKAVGKTPLPNLGVLSKLTLGKHKLEVSAPGYAPFEEEVDVRFQKVSQVVVRLIASDVVLGTGKTTPVERRPVYSRTWFIVTAIVTGVVVGGLIGAQTGKVKCINGVDGSAC
ncbi:MAG: PEGA domain-containing protein [Deltaproteobacteria bacterium]|nr:PEGA domain-containing protein [Deltaproteobacteria bacterium]